MGQERLRSLVLLHIKHSMTIDPDAVISSFVEASTQNGSEGPVIRDLDIC